jgi:hypothetical protein
MGRVRAVGFIFGLVALAVLFLGFIVALVAGSAIGSMPSGGNNTAGILMGGMIVCIVVVVGPFFCWAVLKSLSEIHRQQGRMVELLMARPTTLEVPPIAGAQRADLCPSCGGQVAASARFCGICGTAISHTP